MLYSCTPNSATLTVLHQHRSSSCPQLCCFTRRTPQIPAAGSGFRVKPPPFTPYRSTYVYVAIVDSKANNESLQRMNGPLVHETLSVFVLRATNPVFCSRASFDDTQMSLVVLGGASALLDVRSYSARTRTDSKRRE